MNIQRSYQNIKRADVHAIHPEGLIRSLIIAINSPCNCGSAQRQAQQNYQQLNCQIQGLRQQISCIRAQVQQVEKLLRVRDSLQKELDLLRDERRKIQLEIQSVPCIENRDKAKYICYREMNQRLRRRIVEVRQFVQKMDDQNSKIQGGILSNNQFAHYRQQQLFLRRRKQQLYQGLRLNMTSFQSIVTKLHDRQQQAWRRVRRQQYEIQRHNLQARSRNGNNFTYYSPKARTYYSPI